ncbi:hypothetical protein [uncultured Jatrophihabitans sp.]|uniref:hypothetical protein n=1 Tax=uncultured Jatrophihabitans sp. TaxID=1610747 RepID=UPI0035CAE4E2
MSSLDVQAELRKLAHTLDVDESALTVLATVPADDLRILRAQIGEAMFRADKHHFTRVAALSKTVPAAVTAKLTEAALPPLLAARTAELLEPARAADMVTRIGDRYLADVSAVMDPARAPEVVAAIPPERVATTGLELARRGEWVAMGAFVSYISPEALRVSIARYDGEQLLRLGFVLDDNSRLETIGGLLTDAQIDDVLAAASAYQLWAELGELVGHLTGTRLTRLTARYAAASALHPAYEAAVASGEFEKAAFARLTA